MKPVVRLDTGNGPMDVTASELPVPLGLSVSGEVLFGADAETSPLAWLGTADGAVFMQRTPGDTKASFNGEPLQQSVWLAAGDEIRLAAAIIDVGEHDGRLLLTPRPARPRPLLVPPPSEPPGSGVTRVGGTVQALVEPATKASLETGEAGTSGDDPGAVDSSPATAAEAPPESSPGLEPLLPIDRQPGPRKRHWAAWSLLALLLVGVLMTLVAAPLTVTVDPEPDRVAVVGLVPPLKFADRYLALPGEYRLEAEKAGYHRLEATFSFGFGEQPVFGFSLVKLPGLLRIDTPSVAAAQVFIDGDAAGATPLVDVEVAAGPHTVTVVAERFLPAEVGVDVVGMGRSQQVEVELVPDWGHALVDSEPPGATVVVDDEEIGSTPLRVERKAGTYDLQLHKQGWQSVSQSLKFQANTETLLPAFVLAKAPGTVSLTTTPPGATVLVDGSSRGTTPLELELSGDAEHEIVVDKQGYSRLSRTVRVGAGQTRTLTLALSCHSSSASCSSPANPQMRCCRSMASRVARPRNGCVFPRRRTGSRSPNPGTRPTPRRSLPTPPFQRTSK